jgi:phage tail-like protein
VLESTTQALDARIGAMGARADPATASPDWMDFTARWIGLPWNDALEAPIKRRILEHAAGITAARGTRRGLETLLECLLPTAADESRRYRVTDAASDFGFAVAGGAGCCGSALPAVLGGRSRAAAVTDHGILGRIRLPCGDDQQDAEPFTGVVRVDLAADAAQRSAWEPWLAGLLSAMAPATTRVRLRWISPALLHGDRLEDGRTLDDAPLPRLGTDAITGLARLPDDPFGSLPGSLAPGTRLH